MGFVYHATGRRPLELRKMKMKNETLVELAILTSGVIAVIVTTIAFGWILASSAI